MTKLEKIVTTDDERMNTFSFNYLKTLKYKISFMMTIIDDLQEYDPVDEVLSKKMMTFQYDQSVYKVFTIKGLL